MLLKLSPFYLNYCTRLHQNTLFLGVALSMINSVLRKLGKLFFEKEIIDTFPCSILSLLFRCRHTTSFLVFLLIFFRQVMCFLRFLSFCCRSFFLHGCSIAFIFVLPTYLHYLPYILWPKVGQWQLRAPRGFFGAEGVGSDFLKKWAPGSYCLELVVACPAAGTSAQILLVEGK
jgi:hypothetical protein